jgi:hypothetical protein
MCCVKRFKASCNTQNIEAAQRAFSEKRISTHLGLAASLVFAFLSSAQALPSFARQTGQPCGACHIDYPSLTPFGRQFKLNGYTAGGGRYRTTLFPSQSDPAKPLADYADNPDGRRRNAAPANGETDTGNVWVPPVSMMAIVGYTHRNQPLDPAAAAPYKPNNNTRIEQASVFWGGAITDHIGAFAQVTYEGPPVGGADPQDPNSSFQWHWDNVDVRYANTSHIAGIPVTYGVTANNNPSMADPWNTTPTWGFPYVAAGDLAPGPSASTLIDGTLGQTVAGVGGYAFFNNLVYLQLSGFQTLKRDTLAKLGTDSFDAPVIDGVAPYWRLAIEPHWGRNWWEFGTFGISARVHPWTMNVGANGLYEDTTFPQTDRYMDVGFDTQYQYQGDNYWLTLRATYIHEKQTLDASSLNSGTNPSNTLNTLRLYGSVAYGSDSRVVLTGQYFDTWGSSDPGAYSELISCTAPNTACSPNSNGYLVELAFIPFNSSMAPVWPWANARYGLQYTYYNKFDGDPVHAHDNNTLFLYAWFAM